MSFLPGYFKLAGGLDLMSSAAEINPGHVIAGLNYEPVPRGYGRIKGFERFDGRTKPSEAKYWVLPFDAATAAITAGEDVEGDVSGATATALLDAVVTSGSYVDGDAAGYLVLTALTGVFQDGEDLQVATVTRSVAAGAAVQSGATNNADDTAWSRAAIEAARALIGAVPGEGPVRGVWAFAGTTYAFRNAVGSASCVMHRSSATGWQAVALGRKIGFSSGGTYVVSEGDTITGATSGATAVVTRVVVMTGDWASGDAEGWIFFATQTAPFQAENLNVGANTNVATIAGDSAEIVLGPSGAYEFVNHNFYGASNLKRMYGCDGVNQAFEFDGTVFVQIDTGMSDDKPQHIAAHKNHLFLAFAGGSLQHSATAEPCIFEVILGAGEIGLGEDINRIISNTQVLVAVGRSKVAVLYGSDFNDWFLEPLNNVAGGKAHSVEYIIDVHYVDDAGLRSLSATSKFGDFSMGTTLPLVDPFFKMQHDAGVQPCATIVCRTKSQMRVFFEDGRGLSVYFGRKMPEALPFDLGFRVHGACSSQDADGNEVMFFGDEDGMVYQMDAGTSFDGEPVDAFLSLAYFHARSPSFNKQWGTVEVLIDAAPSASIGVLADFGWGDPNLVAMPEQSFQVAAGGGFWNRDFWNQFYWSNPVVGKAKADIRGFGPAIGLTFISSSIYEDPHTFQAVTVQYSMRGPVR